MSATSCDRCQRLEGEAETLRAQLAAAQRAKSTADHYVPKPLKDSPLRHVYTLEMAQLQDSRDQWKADAQSLAGEVSQLQDALTTQRATAECLHGRVTAMAEGIIQCVDSAWREGGARDWSRPELVLTEYVESLRGDVARLQDALTLAVETRNAAQVESTQNVERRRAAEQERDRFEAALRRVCHAFDLDYETALQEPSA